jgi:hypothetical protein
MELERKNESSRLRGSPGSPKSASSASDPPTPLLRVSPGRNGREVSTRIGTLFIPTNHTRRVRRIPKIPTSPHELCIQEPAAVVIKSNTVPALVGRPAADICASLDKYPLFFRSLYFQTSIDSSQISRIVSALRSNDLKLFVTRMAAEMSLFGSISTVRTVADLEDALMRNIPIQSAVFWVRGDNADFLLSLTTNQVLSMQHSIVGTCLETAKLIVTDDPANHELFNYEYDLPLLRGASSMILLPVISEVGDPLGVIQCVDLFEPATQLRLPFSKYYVRLLKLVRDLVRGRFTRDRDRTDALLGCEVAEILTDFRPTISLRDICLRISAFVRKLVDCQVVDIYEYVARGRTIINLTDGAEYHDTAGGIAYLAAVKLRPIFVAHGLARLVKTSPLDHRLTNCSVLAQSFAHREHQYIFVLRSKWLQPAFFPADAQALQDNATVLCQCLHLAQTVRTRVEEDLDLRRLTDIERTSIEALDRYIREPAGRWAIVGDFATKMFGTQRCIVAVYEGCRMHFLGTDVSW